jgi:tetratricopeptide (TPR) repeat protein
VDIALACALGDLGEHREAIAIYDELLSNPKDGELSAVAHANRGNSHEALGNAEAAIADYEEALRREPTRISHYLNYVRLFALRKRWPEASRVVARGLANVARVDGLPLLLEQARIANEQKHAEAGLAAAEQALSLFPDHPRALYQRAWSLGMLGRLEEARASLRKLLKLEPENKAALKALQQIEAALSL